MVCTLMKMLTLMDGPLGVRIRPRCLSENIWVNDEFPSFNGSSLRFGHFVENNMKTFLIAFIVTSHWFAHLSSRSLFIASIQCVILLLTLWKMEESSANRKDSLERPSQRSFIYIKNKRYFHEGHLQLALFLYCSFVLPKIGYSTFYLLYLLHSPDLTKFTISNTQQ